MTQFDLLKISPPISRSLLRGISTFTLGSTLALSALLGATTSAQSEVENQTHTKTVIVQPGDTLSHIALREMGNALHAAQLALANGMHVNNILQPGDSLNIPTLLPARDESSSDRDMSSSAQDESLADQDKPSSDRDEFASVIFTKGLVTINGETLKTSDKVHRNDIVETKLSGYASLEFRTGTLVNLQPNTVARIVTLHCESDDDVCVIEIAADRGSFSTDVRRDGDQPTDFQVRTPYASAAVRGTVFDVSADPTGLRLGVTEGAVSLSAANTSQVVELDLGFGIISAPGTPMSAPIDLLPTPVFRFVPPRVTKSDIVRWFGLTDVERYTVQIAPESNGVRVVHDAVVTNDAFSFSEDLPPGDFHMVLRAVDSNGLLGFRSITPITIAEIDSKISPVSASVKRENGSYRIQIDPIPDEANGYEVQMASDLEFTDPVSIDIDANGLALVRLEGEKFYARARALLNRTLVGPYGEPTSVDD